MARTQRGPNDQSPRQEEKPVVQVEAETPINEPTEPVVEAQEIEENV